jgi:hypothetical protein
MIRDILMVGGFGVWGGGVGGGMGPGEGEPGRLQPEEVGSEPHANLTSANGPMSMPPPPQYMDRTYVTQQHKTPVFQLGLDLWRDHVVHSPVIQQVRVLGGGGGGGGGLAGRL